VDEFYSEFQQRGLANGTCTVFLVLMTALCTFIAWFFGRTFLANTIPHLISGISGSPIQSPFASPPGEGLSSSTVNVLWGMFNLVVAYILIVRIGRFELRQTRHVVVQGLGILVMALLLPHQFGKFHGGNL
jgi:hypothetical protein